MNLITLTDSYKLSHWKQYPEGTETIFSYMESRGGVYPATIFFGLQYYLKEYLSKPITAENIDEAEAYARFHGVPFNREGWERILTVHGGYIPIMINAVPEGQLYPTGEVLLTIQNTDSELPWVTNWFETLLMKIWYPTTVATKAYYVKEVIKGAYKKSSDSEYIDFQYHNFGDRGSTSVEAAMVGGMAHLTQFSGTDNFNAVIGLEKYYGVKKGWSIPATEHSTVTSWGEMKEFMMIDNYLENNKGQPIIACVMDSYDIYSAVDFISDGGIKDKILSDDYPTFVIRPDSGNPLMIIPEILAILSKNKIPYTLNSKGFKVLTKYRIIWGDGIDPKMIMQILNLVISLGYSAENIAFGSGGDLMQKVDRDTQKFAIKCSAAKVKGEWRDVFKDPITDPGKKSKKGVLVSENLVTVFKNGVITCNTEF